MSIISYQSITVRLAHVTGFFWNLYVTLEDSGESDIYEVGSIPTCDNQ